MSSLRLCFRAVAAAVFFLAVTFAHAEPLDIDLPAQALTTSIQQLSLQSGLSIGGDASLLEGRTAPAVKGNMEPADALRQLLQGSGLSVSFEGNQAIIGSPTPVLVIKGARDGSAEAGYTVKNVKNFGFLGEKAQQDMPYSTYIISEELIENTMSTEFETIVKMYPFAGMNNWTTYNRASLNSRGITGTVYIEGLRMAGNGDGFYLENKAGIEVLNGYSGFLFGAGVGNVINFNLKRPTAEPINKVTVMGRTKGTGYVHADVGGPLTSSSGFRLNVAYQDGETALQDQNDRRKFVSLGVDFRPTDDLTFFVNASYGERKLNGLQSQFNLYDNALEQLPDPVSGRHLWGPKDAFNEWKDTNLHFNTKWKVVDWLSLRADYNYLHSEHNYLRGGALLAQHDGAYNFTGMRINQRTATAPGFEGHAYGLYATAKAETFGVKHTLTLGSNGYNNITKAGLFINNTDRYNNATVFNCDWGDWRCVQNIPMFDFDAVFTGHRRKTAKEQNLNLMFGDEIALTEQWIFFVGVNHSNIINKSWNFTTRAVSGEYDKSAWSPTFSVMYKPVPATTFYATYMEALERGTTVGSTYKNAGEILEPMKSESYEVGLKQEISDGALVSLALYQLDRALTYSDDGSNTGTLTQDGLQQHRGMEITAQGRLMDNLTVMGGFGYLHSLRKRTLVDQGKSNSGQPEIQAKMYAELNIPSVKGLALTGGAYRQGSAWAGSANNKRYPAYTVFDMGARHKSKISGVNTTFRLNVANLTNAREWRISYPNEPRSVLFSATTEF